MNKKKVYEWLGGVAVVASLLLVAYEIRQNTNALSAQAVFELNSQMSGVSQAIAENPEFAELFRRGDENPDSLTDAEWYRYYYAVLADLNNYESAFAFYDEGIIDAELYHGYLKVYCMDAATPGYRRVLSESPDVYYEGFRKNSEEFCPKH